MATELTIPYHTTKQTHVSSVDTVVLVKRQGNQGANVNLDFIFCRDGRCQLIVQAMNAFYQKHGVFRQLQFIATIFTQASLEIILRNFYPFTSQQTNQVCIEKFKVNGINGFKIVITIRFARCIHTVHVVVIHRNRNGTNTIYCQLDANALGGTGLTGRGRSCDEDNLNSVTVLSNFISNGSKLFLVKSFCHLDDFILHAHFNIAVQLGNGIALNHSCPLFRFTEGSVQFGKVLKIDKLLPIAKGRVIKNKTFFKGHNTKISNVTCVRTKCSEKITYSIAQ